MKKLRNELYPQNSGCEKVTSDNLDQKEQKTGKAKTLQFARLIECYIVTIVTIVLQEQNSV